MSRFKTYGGRNDHPYAMLHKGQSRRVTTMPINGGLQVSVLMGNEAPPYDELINFPRAKGKDEIRCVMCGSTPGLPGCVIPRQNKDVCKECDKSTWQHISSSIFFKWCKGCKKFLRLGSFSEKLDAAKCDRCRERGRQSYLLKKGKEPEIRLRSSSESYLPMERTMDQSSAHHQNIHIPADVTNVANLGEAEASHVSLSSGDDDYQNQSDSNMCNSEDEECDPGPQERRYAGYRRTRAYSEDCRSTYKRVDRRFCDRPDVKGNDHDQSNGKLSGAFGMPLQSIIDESKEPSKGFLFEVASIYQRIISLEDRASQVTKLEQLAKEKETLTELLERDRKRLMEQVAASRNKERVLLEEAGQLRAEVVSLREQPCSRCGKYSREAWEKLELQLEVTSSSTRMGTRMTRSCSFSSHANHKTKCVTRSTRKRPRIVSLGD